MQPLSEAVGIARDTGRAAGDLAGLPHSPDENERMQGVREGKHTRLFIAQDSLALVVCEGQPSVHAVGRRPSG